MRLRLTCCVEKPSKISINYQYQLFSAIYRLLSASSTEYSTFLHSHGYLGKDGKPRKLFTFSFLRFGKPVRVQNGHIVISSNTHIELILSSPMLQDFIQHFVVGLFVDQRIRLKTNSHQADFQVIRVETLPEPEFQPVMQFRALSPIVLTTKIDTDAGVKTYYYRPLDRKLSDAVRQSLMRKHETAYGTFPENKDLSFEVDIDYIQRKGGEKGVSKLITLRQGSVMETKVKGFIAPFTLKGSPELMRTAWECGIGDKCSMGFGCVAKQ